MKKIFCGLFCAPLCAIVLCSCADILQTVRVQGFPEKKPWTILIYMAADNDLESAALHDINEMESVLDKNAAYSILVLLDRAEGWDGTNGNWTGTRLYEIKRDSGGYNGTIISNRLSCSDLDLTAESETELNMSDPNTLKGFIAFAAREYPAERTALIFWGHGTGWRSSGIAAASTSTKAVAIDDADNAYMDLPSVKRALGETYFDAIGFDTCFGAAFETAYELADNAKYLAASPGIIPTEGWDYTGIFSRFDSAMTGEDFCDVILQSFKIQYASMNAYAISKLHLPSIKSAAQAFCAFTQTFADTITDRASQNASRVLLTENVKKECAPAYPSDLFLDAENLIEVLNAYAQESAMADDAKTEIMNAAATANAALNAGVAQTIRGGQPVPSSVSVFFATRTGPTAFSGIHFAAYVKDSDEASQSAFVKTTAGWTPTRNHRGSLLDKIFYTTY